MQLMSEFLQRAAGSKFECKGMRENMSDFGPQSIDVSDMPSPNFDDRKSDVSVLVLHYTGMKTEQEALERLCDPDAKVSAHYTITEAGRIYAHVPEAKRAWHAGVASWRGQTDVNSLSVGIELVNPGHEFGYRSFPDAQMDSLIHLSRDIIRRHKILSCNIVGHSDVAPGRKQDPGELFDWARLARSGIGLWPRPTFRTSMSGTTIDPSSSPEMIMELQAALEGIGYGLTMDGVYGDKTTAVVTAFQRHFWQGDVTGLADPATIGLIGHISGLAAVELFTSP